MALIWMEGDILKSPAHALVNPVNCCGIMGKGLAKGFADKWPKMFRRYAKACEVQSLKLGKCMIDRHQEPWIINFPTKNHWKHKAHIEQIEYGLGHLEIVINRYNVQSLAVPALGCGNGGLRWSDVGPMLTAFATNADIDVMLYAPHPPGQ